jgi:hypothetical protein
MEEKSREFAEQGSGIYAKAWNDTAGDSPAAFGDSPDAIRAFAIAVYFTSLAA